ncbi:MAG: YlxR family protein [Acidimicrobiales bacterium]
MAPRRTCIGCRRVARPDELVRVVAGPDGGLVVGRHLPGRGAWLCQDSPRCVELAGRRKAFSRALRTDIRPDAAAALQSSAADRARMEEFESHGPAAG